MINACFEIFDKKYAGTSLAVFSTNLGRTACFSELKKHDITFNYNVLFDDAYNFNKNIVWDLDALEYDIVHIDGHGSTIAGSAEERTEYKWANIGENMLYVNNMTIKGFNNAIVNRGICSLNNVILRDNKMDYRLIVIGVRLFLMLVIVFVIIVLLLIIMQVKVVQYFHRVKFILIIVHFPTIKVIVLVIMSLMLIKVKYFLIIVKSFRIHK